VVPVGETGLRDQCRSLKIKNLQTPAKQRMKAFMSQGKQFPRLASSFSLTEKLAENNSGPTSVTKLMS
jgi:hypothetical protein